MSTDSIERNLPKALTAWYDFAAGSRVLYVAGGDEACGGICEDLKEKGLSVSELTADEAQQHGGHYDYIVAVGVVERSREPVALLTILRSLLAPHGVLLLGTENRLGIRYFCGDQDKFSGHVLDGIDGYIQINAQQMAAMAGRMYARSELADMLAQAGVAQTKCYSVMPTLTRPQILISEDYQPNELLDSRIFPQYSSPETVFLEEERLYSTLLENHMFHRMANGYLIECPADGQTTPYDQITVQGDRSRTEAMATLITEHKEVRKKALYPEGKTKIQGLCEQQQYLQAHHVPMVSAHVEGDSFVMPYVDGQIATRYFQDLLVQDKTAFLREMECFRQLILDSSEHVSYDEVNWQHFEPYWEKRKGDDPNLNKWERLAHGSEQEQADIGVILKKGYVDMVSLNCFHTDSGFQFFDQEFYIEDFPANTILMRSINFIYQDRPDLEQIYPKDELLQHFRLYEHRVTWCRKSDEFIERLRNEKELSVYHRLHRRNWKTMAANRHRMNYPQDEYNRLFIDIFKDIDGKKIYLFGSGRYAQQFVEQFGNYCEIAGVLDNNAERWGADLDGLPILSPTVLQEQTTPYKVLICIKYFEKVLAQLKEMGVKNYAVFNPSLEYERPVKITVPIEQTNSVSKPYHIGYVAGVFDLFHIGHLNLLRRAKEQCDYLIVGVVSDEQVIRGKKTSPYIPYEERFEIVRACRYVDEAVGLPINRSDTEDAWHMYHFDAQFSGSDYENDPDWLAKRAFLEQHGADLVFFPYTQGTSSTKLKAAISK